MLDAEHATTATHRQTDPPKLVHPADGIDATAAGAAAPGNLCQSMVYGCE